MSPTGQPHPSFPARPFASTFHGKLPERSNAPSTGFGATAQHTSTRENARLERERQERDRGQREAQAMAQAGSGPPNPLSIISDEQREEINEAFSLFDLDKDSRIDYHEFKVSLKALGFDLPKGEILDLLTRHGVSPEPQGQNQPSSSRHPQLAQQQHRSRPGRLVLTLQAFQSISATLISQRDPRDEILRAFALFDAEDKGVITIDDLRRVSRELGEGLDDDELSAMIDEFDLEGNGGIGSEDFVDICSG